MTEPLPESLFKKIPAWVFFCDFCKIFKSPFSTEPLGVTTSGSSVRYLKAYQNYINWGNTSDFNANTERIFAVCDNTG